LDVSGITSSLPGNRSLAGLPKVARTSVPSAAAERIAASKLAAASEEGEGMVGR
jgi:hypothetical protein